MKQISRLATAAALAVGSLASGQALAADICVNCLYTAAGTTYLGVHNPNTFDSSDLTRVNISVAVPTFIQDTWIFDIAPAGRAEVNLSFNPINVAFTGFSIQLFDAAGTVCGNGIGNAIGTTGFCGTTMVNGLALGSGVAGISGSTLFPVSLAAGRYAWVVTGTAQVLNPGQQGRYSGQMTVSVIPEPGSLALVGLALIGAAAGLRRNRKA